MKYGKQILSVILCGSLLISAAVPAFAAGTETASTPSEKEEVIYINLNNDGSVKNTYVVNSFKGGDIVDYGEYISVKMLNTSDPIQQSGDIITFSSSAKKVYYQGELAEDTQIPWNISLKYYLDGKEYSADEIAGKSGKLKIRFQITKNTSCSGSFYEEYALQASFTLDTEQCSNISAPDATVANVGGSKQLSYTVLPGKGLDTTISADVTDFEMSAVAINGIHLNLNVEVDDAELKDKVSEIIDAVKQLDRGAVELADGSEELRGGTSELKEGASSLHSGIASLDEGVGALQSGLGTVQKGLNRLNGQSSALVSGSKEVQTALRTIQTAVNSISVSSGELSELTGASGQIKNALSDLCDGAATLQSNLGYAQYKALMYQNGLDIDELKNGNNQAISNLSQQIEALQVTWESIKDIPEMAEQAGQLEAQIYQLQQVVVLLNGNNAAIIGTESYLNGVAAQLPALTEGLAELKNQYEIFDASISQLVDTLSGMMENLSLLSEGINQLAEKYEELDEGIGEYTGGVSQIVTGYSQVMEGVSALAQGSRELVSGSGELYDGTVELYDGVISLCGGAQELANGTGEFCEETSDMDEQIEEEIDSLLESIGGSTEDPVSFVSEKNINVDSVQFVIQTEAIEIEEIEELQEDEAEELSFWQKLLNLFKK